MRISDPALMARFSCECGAGGVGLIPKALAKNIAKMLNGGVASDTAPVSNSSLAMVPEADENDDE